MVTDHRIRSALSGLDALEGATSWNETPTHVEVLTDVDADAALWRPQPDMKCIRDIALHVAYWEDRVTARLTGATTTAPFAEREPGDPEPAISLTPSAWNQERAYVAAARNRLVNAVAELNPDELDQPVNNNPDRTTIDMIHQITVHSMYHTAQIKILSQLSKQRTLYGS